MIKRSTGGSAQARQHGTGRNRSRLASFGLGLCLAAAPAGRCGEVTRALHGAGGGIGGDTRVAVSDADGSSAENGPTAPADGNSAAAAAAAPFGSGPTNRARLASAPDTTRPTLVTALNQGPTRIILTYSEPVEPTSATNRANYAVDGGVAVTGLGMGADTRTVLIEVATLAFGTNYTITISGVFDRAAPPNSILPNSPIRFTALEFFPQSVGSPTLAGLCQPVAGGLDLAGAGKTIGGTSDQFQFGWKRQSGDFDLQARVAGTVLPDPYGRAGIMVRESLDANARFGAVFAGSPLIGCFFQSRSATGGAAAVASPAGGCPVNTPYTWLRLRRQGTTVTGYASLDAQTWTSLGSATLSSLPAQVYLGLAVSSDTETAVASGQFRDIGPTPSLAVGSPRLTKEPLGPCSRATSLIISEILYHPAPRTDGRRVEFVELANARSVPEELAGWRISGAIDYTFPAGYWLNAGACVVIAAVPDDVQAVYGITNVLGPFSGSLPHGTGTLRLRNEADAIRLELAYSSDPPWPVAADGAGHSMVLARPSLGEADPAAWSASEFIGGSPGSLDPTVPTALDNVVINEFLAHTDPPLAEYIELYNHSNAGIDLSGCWISDEPAIRKFEIPAGTSIAVHGVLAFDSARLGFRLNAAGATLYFGSADGRRILDAVRYGAQERGVATGRYPDGDPTIRRLARPTFGNPNAAWRQEPVVINEVMFAPISGDPGDQYIELYNRSADPLDLGGWQLRDAVAFTFPTNTAIPGQGYIVVAKDAGRLLGKYPQLNARNTVGEFKGQLSNNGERIVLTRPLTLISTSAQGVPTANLIQVPVTEVTYGAAGRWSRWADAGGSSLELVSPDADPLRAANWLDSDESAKAPWTTVAVTNLLELGNTSYAPNRLRIAMQDAGECLVDDIEVFRNGTQTNLVANGDFNAGATGWSCNGNHSLSAVETGTGVAGTGCLHVRGADGGDTGQNSLRTALRAGLANGNPGVIRAKVRWLRGWPEVLFRLHGNHLELPAAMAVPTNLGTPGLPNSRWLRNPGPAIYDVTHRPALPRSGEAVKVTCRATDPDGLGALRLDYRLDPGTNVLSIALRDDGTAGDDVAGDGLYTATIPGQGKSVLVAFRIQARDSAASPATAWFAGPAPAPEALIRWDEPIPTGTFSHYHLWSTAATEQAFRSAPGSPGLDNTWRDATLVCGNFRVIYNVGFRNKGSPWHQGYGDLAVNVPQDDLLLGTTERNFASTGNGGQEETDIRSQLAAWLAQKLGIPYLHAHYIRVYRNGSLFRTVCEDLEVPNRQYAKRGFPEGGRGDLYKLAMWFEFADDNLTFSNPVHCTLGRFPTAGVPRLARYRWNWERRPDGGTANNYTNLFDLVSAANDTSANYTSRMLNLVDTEEWMRVFGFHRITGNWDSWTYNVGQNMFALKQPGYPWVLIPWDIDFTFGLGDGASSPLGGGSFGGNNQDPVMNAFYNNPTFRRSLWRTFADAVAGPLLTNNYAPQIAARRSVLLKNGISDATDPRGIGTYIDQRRNYLSQQIKANDAKQFAVTSNGGSDYTSTTPTTAIQGTAPFTVATIEVNGVPYPITWSSQTVFRLTVPLLQATNPLVLVGKDLRGVPVTNATRAFTVVYTGAIPQARDYVAINEIHYNPVAANASFVELYNRSASVPFDLSGFRLDGLGYVFPAGAILGPRGYFVLAKDRAAFSAAYGATIPVFDEYGGSLDNNGEHLALVQPGVAPAEDRLISDVRYHNHLPWPTNTAGLGSALQLIDSAQDAYRAGNWAATSTNDPARVTPGRTNAVAQTLAAFPPLWINELQPVNTGAGTDSAGPADPWIELYNSGADTLDLTPYYLTDSYTNLTRWPFPTGSSIGPGQCIRIWTDGDSSQTTATDWHTSFRLAPERGSVALVRLQGSGLSPAVMDYVDYAGLPPGRSYGCWPDGEPRRRQLFFHPTPQAANDPAWPALRVTINEVLAGNTTGLVNPATGRHDDWFELYNNSAADADLSGYTLTDNLANPQNWTIPLGTVVRAGGFLLGWADKQSASNAPGTDLHAGFRLAKSGSDIGLFDPSGALVDGFSFGPQTPDVSTGRYPDGADLPLQVLDRPTPRAANTLAGGNQPPVFTAFEPRSAPEGAQLHFIFRATDPDPGQRVTYSLGTNAPAGATLDARTGNFFWRPGEDDGPAAFAFDVVAGDNGSPVRTATLRVSVTVTEVNQPPAFDTIAGQVTDELALWQLLVHATDAADPPSALEYGLDIAPAGAGIDAGSGRIFWTPTEAQGPTNAVFVIRATRRTPPNLSATATFSVNVNEVNRPPVLAVPADQVLAFGQSLFLAITAVDPDIPANTLTYALALDAPAGMRLDAGSGVLEWMPAADQAPATNRVTVRVTDDGSPPLSDSRTFTVIVLPPPPAVSAVGLTPDGFPTFVWGTIPGRTYSVEFTDSLVNPAWQPLADIVAVAAQTRFADSSAGGVRQRYYRIRLEF
jgi:hypothetical protein